MSIGLKESLEVLVSAVKKEIDAGYQRIKIKIKPGKDIELVQRLRQEFPKIKLMVDANSAYRLEDWPLLKQLEGYYLMMIEQPLGWDDIFSHIELQQKLDTPICLDECIHTEEHALAAVTHGRLQNHQYEARPRGRIHAGEAHSRYLPAARRAGVVRRHAGNRHRPRAQHRALHAAKFHAARRCDRQQALLA